MELKTYFAQDSAGNIVPSVQVTLFISGTTTVATGLTNAAGTAISNPFTADGSGRIQFRAPDGLYDMKVNLGANVSQVITIQCLDYAVAKQAIDESLTARDEAVAANESVQDTAAILPTTQQFIELQTTVDAIIADPVNAVTSIVIPAKDFDLAMGSATYGMVASRLAGWQFSHGADAAVTKMIDLPSHWSKMRISFIWANLVANSGNVSLSGLIHSWSAGESFNQTPAGGAVIPAANATPYIAIESQIGLDLNVDPTRHTTIRVGRNGTSASDTLPTAFVLLAIRLTKVA